MPNRYYQKNKEGFSEKRHVEGIKIFLRKKKIKSVNIIVNATKIFLKVKNRD